MNADYIRKSRQDLKADWKNPDKILYCGKQRRQTSLTINHYRPFSACSTTPYSRLAPINDLCMHFLLATNPKPRQKTLPSQKHIHVTSSHSSNIRVDLLYFILVTCETFHSRRSSLKLKAERNTVARREGQLHLQVSTRQEGGSEEP
jgi:hypothetical protein